MHDMQPDQIVGEYVEHTLNYYDGSSRKVLVTEIETEFPEGCLIVSRTNTNGVITHCNESFVNMSGYAKEELIGHHHTLLRHPDMPSAAFGDLWSTLEKGEKWNGYVKNLRKDGGYYWVYVSAIPNVRNGVTQGYTSVRREPSREKVEESITLYQSMA